tara:strand:- start:365 stop:667 length:303 start_codon:yes stop_codon:yes gene_type:complete
MSSQLALEILSLSAGLSQFSNFQIVNLGQQNNLVAIAPEYVFSLHSFSDQVVPLGLVLDSLSLFMLYSIVPPSLRVKTFCTHVTLTISPVESQKERFTGT